MKRPKITKYLSKMLVKQKFSGIGKYYASEVTLDYTKRHSKRIDFLEFKPRNTTPEGINDGIFICYEIKSCKEDIYSGNGLNFIGDKNYIVTTVETYKKILPDIESGKLANHIKNCNPESSTNFGIIVPIPKYIETADELDNPTPFKKDNIWELRVVKPCRKVNRQKSMNELLFCMLRSGV